MNFEKIETAYELILENIQLMHLINDEGIDGTKQMLTSAALTYVAAVLSTMFQMLRLIMAFTNKRD